MAKQKSIFKITGKVDDTSFFHTRNGGYQMRRINPNMSERVKTEANFENTRLNAAEFGAAGSCASAMVRPLLDRHAYILTPIMVGELTKEISKYMKFDTDHPAGQRKLPESTFDTIRMIWNNLLKNPMQSMISFFLWNHARYNATQQKFVLGQGLVTTQQFEKYYMDRGADGLLMSHYEFYVSTPEYDIGYGGYGQSIGRCVPISMGPELVEFDGNGNNAIYVMNSYPVPFPMQNGSNSINGYLVVMQPYKEVNNQKLPLVNLCSAFWVTTPLTS